MRQIDPFGCRFYSAAPVMFSSMFKRDLKP
jgi:hypothetical protein